MASPEYKWVESGGGPLLFLDMRHLAAWEGIDPPSGGRVVEAAFRWSDPDAPATDYDRAVDVDDLVAALPVGGGTALIFGDEPMATTWVADPDGKGGVFVRWEFGESEEEVAIVLEAVRGAEWVDTGISLDLPSGLGYLFDSACPGAEVGEVADFLEVKLSPGTYRVSTTYASVEEEFSFVLHRLSR